MTGERLSAYRFSGVHEQPPTVRVVKEFSWQKRTGLLVGLEEAEGSVLCLYDLGISRVVKAVVLPGRVCTFSLQNQSFYVVGCCIILCQLFALEHFFVGGVFLCCVNIITSECAVKRALM